MLKKMILASAVALILAGTMVTVTPAPAEAGTCKTLAKAKFPDDRKARKAYKKACKAEKKAHKNGLLGGLRG
jgi:hypothetical protein